MLQFTLNAEILRARYYIKPLLICYNSSSIIYRNNSSHQKSMK